MGRGGHRKIRACSLVPGIVDRGELFEAERSDGQYLGDVGSRFRPVEMRGTTWAELTCTRGLTKSESERQAQPT